MLDTTYKSPLHKTVGEYPTDFWNDSCSVEELAYAIEHGAVGATSNPTIVEQVLKQERHLWEGRINELIAANTTWSDEDVMAKIFEEIALKGAELLLPVFERENGMKVEEFDTYGATVRTLRGFITSYHELTRAIREDFLLPNPDVK